MGDLDDITAEDVRRYLRSEGWEQGHTEPCFEGWHRVGRWLLIRRDVEDDLRRLARRQERPLAAIAADVRRLRDEAADVADIVSARGCGHCGLHPTPEGHDGCLGTIPGAMNACCGHGNVELAYIQYRAEDAPDAPGVWICWCGTEDRSERGRCPCGEERTFRIAGDDALQLFAARIVADAQAPPEPAADVHTVTGCGDCPASYVTLTPLYGPERWCGLDDARTSLEGTPPDWCPLRRGPVTLRLEER